MSKHILIIDDEKLQAENLAKILWKSLGSFGFTFEPLWEEEIIKEAINTRFFSLVVLDIRMDSFSFDGMKLFADIVQKNSMSKIIFVSAYIKDFLNQINDALATGNVLAIKEKAVTSFDQFAEDIGKTIVQFFQTKTDGRTENSRMLENAYARAKNCTNSQEKGLLFEEFLVNLFGQMGFGFIQKRVTDDTSETDLILRNDLSDGFLSKFGKYIFVEAKNRPSVPVKKDDFVVFRAKLDSSNQLAELGIIVSAFNVASTVRLEALRTSKESGKILLFSHNELMRLIMADDKLYEFKKLIDEQIKDIPV